MKAILAHLAGGDADEGVLNAALSVGRRFNAHIDALHTRLDPSEIGFLYGGEAFAEGVPELQAAIERDADRFAKRAKQQFDRWCAAHALSVGWDPGRGPGVSATWRETTGLPQRAIARAGRVADLIVTSRLTDDPSMQTWGELQAALFDTGRPVLLVRAPRVGRGSTANRSGRLERQPRGRADGRPLDVDHRGAGSGHRGHRRGGGRPGLRRRRACHILEKNGISARSSILDAAGGVGPRLLALTRDVGAELLIMGAYTHSRVRQMVFGGVTRHVIGSAQLPILMSR